jgi:hypothetical protein
MEVKKNLHIKSTTNTQGLSPEVGKKGQMAVRPFFGSLKQGSLCVI